MLTIILVIVMMSHFGSIKDMFIRGVTFAICVVSLAQDYMGKDAYIQYANDNWFEMHWAWWLIPILFIFFNEYKHRKVARWQR